MHSNYGFRSNHEFTKFRKKVGSQVHKTWGLVEASINGDILGEANNSLIFTIQPWTKTKNLHSRCFILKTWVPNYFLGMYYQIIQFHGSRISLEKQKDIV
jgi:hypothetical protein